MEYLPFGPIASCNYGNGLTTQIDYYRNLSIQNININPLSIHRTYAYDSSQNITRIDINYPSLTTNNYAYDSINQLTSANGSWGTLSLSYDRSGNRTTKTSGAGVTNYSYTLNKISELSGIESDHFTHDAKGNMTSNEQFQYIYDLNNRLIRIEDLSDIIANYTYDGEGKRIKKQVGDVNTLYFYDQDGRLISEIKDNHCIDYIYLGDVLIARGEAPLEISHEMNIPAGWNMISLPILPDNASVSSLFPDAKVVYGYKKGAGYVRVKNEEEMELGKGYWILLDQNQTYIITGRLIQSYTLPVNEDGWRMIGGCTSGTRLKTDRCNIVVIYKYVQGSGYQRILTSEEIQPGEGYWILCRDVEGQCELRADTTGSFAKLEAEKEAVINPDHILFYHLDHLNTPILMSNQDGTIVWEAEYLPFGQAIINEDPDGNDELVVNNIRFPGQYYDAESGLHYNIMRYYDPELGRYLTPDPIGFTGGDLNLYRYVRNIPVRWVDSLGFCEEGLVEKDPIKKLIKIINKLIDYKYKEKIERFFKWEQRITQIKKILNFWEPLKEMYEKRRTGFFNTTPEKMVQNIEAYQDAIDKIPNLDVPYDYLDSWQEAQDLGKEAIKGSLDIFKRKYQQLDEVDRLMGYQ